MKVNVVAFLCEEVEVEEEIKLREELKDVFKHSLQEIPSPPEERLTNEDVCTAVKRLILHHLEIKGKYVELVKEKVKYVVVLESIEVPERYLGYKRAPRLPKGVIEGYLDLEQYLKKMPPVAGWTLGKTIAFWFPVCKAIYDPPVFPPVAIAFVPPWLGGAGDWARFMLILLLFSPVYSMWRVRGKS